MNHYIQIYQYMLIIITHKAYVKGFDNFYKKNGKPAKEVVGDLNQIVIDS